MAVEVMTRYNFKVGPGNLNSDYAYPVSVVAGSYNEAWKKAIAVRGYSERDCRVWFLNASDEIVVVPECLTSEGDGHRL